MYYSLSVHFTFIKIVHVINLENKRLFYWQNELIQEWQRNCNLGHANYSKLQVSLENIGEQPYFIWKKKLERDALNPRPLEESKSSEGLSCRSH